jgi:hypothetical protein
MRRILTLGCCALLLTFGFIAGAAHVHESADYHEDSRGVHLDHVHLNDLGDHGHGYDGSDEGDVGQARIGEKHDAHHDGDVVYLDAAAVRSLGSSVRLTPASDSTGVVIVPPLVVAHCEQAMPGQQRDPPRRSRIRPRAPPA